MTVWLQVSLLLVIAKLEMLEAPSPPGVGVAACRAAPNLHHTSCRGPSQRGPSGGTTAWCYINQWPETQS